MVMMIMMMVVSWVLLFLLCNKFCSIHPWLPSKTLDCYYSQKFHSRLVALFTSLELVWLVRRTIWARSFRPFDLPPAALSFNLTKVRTIWARSVKPFDLTECNIRKITKRKKMYFISNFPGFLGGLEEREKIMICKGQSSSEILPPTPTAIFHEKILPPQNVNTNLSLEV